MPHGGAAFVPAEVTALGKCFGKLCEAVEEVAKDTESHVVAVGGNDDVRVGTVLVESMLVNDVGLDL